MQNLATGSPAAAAACANQMSTEEKSCGPLGLGKFYVNLIICSICSRSLSKKKNETPLVYTEQLCEPAESCRAHPIAVWRTTVSGRGRCNPAAAAALAACDKLVPDGL